MMTDTEPAVTAANRALGRRFFAEQDRRRGGPAPELCAPDVEGYIAAAVKLAKDPDRIVELRAGLRERMRASPIGQTTQFARDFFALIESAVKGEV